MLTELVVEYAGQRELARINHDAGNKKPWCDDSIINTYRFCNNRREDDRVTRWIKKYWRDPYLGHKNMAGAMLLARLINWPPTLQQIGFPEKWEPHKLIPQIESLSGKVWSGAYIVSTCGKKMSKAEYVIDKVDDIIGIEEYIPQKGISLEAYHRRLCTVDGLGAGFLAAQVVADLKRCDANLLAAPDWKTFAVSGPGSRRGLSRFFNYPINHSWGEDRWKRHLGIMIDEVAGELPFGETLDWQDWQNVMCEFDKWMRVRTGEGRPRARYTPETAFTV